MLHICSVRVLQLNAVACAARCEAETEVHSQSQMHSDDGE
jgi:hypothetical protein